jgi:hypothetical protein
VTNAHELPSPARGMRLALLLVAPTIYLLAILTAAFIPDGHAFSYEVSVVGLITGVACWVLAIYLWSRRTGNAFARMIVLVLLVLFGFLWGWIYVFVNARRER